MVSLSVILSAARIQSDAANRSQVDFLLRSERQTVFRARHEIPSPNYLRGFAKKILKKKSGGLSRHQK
jgi:hypothetical protein